MNNTKGGAIGKAQYTASQVGDYFIHLCSQKMVDENTPEGVTPLKLQKLLYFSQAAFLALFNKKLFEDEIEAWKYGPVISSIYRKHKNNLNRPIIKATGEYKDIKDGETQDFLKGIIDLLDKYSAGELVEMSHQHAPWKDYYEEGKNIVIPPEVLRSYYKDIFTFEENEKAKA